MVDEGAGSTTAFQGISALLLDMDGVLVSRGQPIAGADVAIARLNAAALPFRVITNTSLSSRERLAERLARVGIAVSADRIVTSLSATLDHLAATMPDGTTYLLGSADAHAEFATTGLRVLSNDEINAGALADAVVIGDSEDQFTFANLNRAFRQLRQGAAFVAMHRNPWWFTAAGPTLDAGSFVVSLEYATGRRATIAGKPSPTIFRAAFRELAAEPAIVTRDKAGPLRRAEVAVVGDDLATDLAPARRLGMRTALVLTGKHGPEVVGTARKGRGFAPDAILPSVLDVADLIVGQGRE